MSLKKRLPTPFSDWWRLLASLGVVFALFHWLALAAGSDRGQAGILVGAVVVIATAAADCLVFGAAPRGVMKQLGLGVPAARGVFVTIAVSGLLLLVVPAYLMATNTPFEMYTGWLLLLPGLFAQAGIAEEVLFRGYLFRHVREGRSFRQAALVASGPFVLVHLLLFATMPWPIALASVLLAALMSFPLAYLFELGGNTVWGPAILHWVAQGAVKVVIPAESVPVFPFVWIAGSAIIPFLVFLAPPRSLER